MSYFNSIKITDGTHDLDITASSAAKVDGSAVTQPVSGTVTANAGTNLNTSALATSALQLADGHNVTIDNASAGSAVNIQDGGNTITVDGTVATTGTYWQSTQPISIASAQVSSGAFASGSIVDGAIVTLGVKTDAKSTATDATSITVMQVLKQISASVQAPPSQAVTNAGTFAVTETTPISGFATSALQLADGHNVVISSGTVTTVSTLSAITGLTMSNAAAQVTGDEAHDAADAGNPIKIGGRAQEPTAALEEVTTDNDRADAAFDRQGRLAVWMGYPVQTAIINDASSGDNSIQAAAGAGLRIAVMGYHLISDGTVDARWEDGAGGTAFTGQMPFQAREGISAGYGIHPMWVGTANTLLNLELSAAINVHGQVSFVVMTD